MKEINLILTLREYDIIRNALESFYYMCKDEGDKKGMEIINDLENKLIKALE